MSYVDFLLSRPACVNDTCTNTTLSFNSGPRRECEDKIYKYTNSPVDILTSLVSNMSISQPRLDPSTYVKEIAEEQLQQELLSDEFDQMVANEEEQLF